MQYVDSALRMERSETVRRLSVFEHGNNGKGVCDPYIRQQNLKRNLPSFAMLSSAYGARVSGSADVFCCVSWQEDAQKLLTDAAEALEKEAERAAASKVTFCWISRASCSVLFHARVSALPAINGLLARTEGYYSIREVCECSFLALVNQR